MQNTELDFQDTYSRKVGWKHSDATVCQSINSQYYEIFLEFIQQQTDQPTSASTQKHVDC